MIELSPIAAAREALQALPPRRRAVILASLMGEAAHEARNPPPLPPVPRFGQPGYRLQRACGDRRRPGGAHK
jgi:hypothetical protein